MNKTAILVIGYNEVTLQSTLHQLNSNDKWNVSNVTTTEEGIEKFHHTRFDVVILTKEIPETEERKLRKIFSHQDDKIILLEESNELVNNITTALEKRNKENKPAFSFVDDALKNAGLPITIQ